MNKKKLTITAFIVAIGFCYLLFVIVNFINTRPTNDKYSEEFVNIDSENSSNTIKHIVSIASECLNDENVISKELILASSKRIRLNRQLGVWQIAFESKTDPNIDEGHSTVYYINVSMHSLKATFTGFIEGHLN